MTDGRQTSVSENALVRTESRPSVSLPQLAKCMSVTHKGHRYWAYGPLSNGRLWRWKFWSDHKWPFYHGSITLDSNDGMAAARAFLRWLPFEVEVR